MPGSVQLLLPVPEGWTVGKPSGAHHSPLLGRTEIDPCDLSLPRSSQTSFAIVTGIRTPQPPGRSQTQVYGLAKALETWSVLYLTAAAVLPNTRLEREQERAICWPVQRREGHTSLTLPPQLTPGILPWAE